MEIIYVVLAIIAFSFIFAMWKEPQCKHENWTEEIVSNRRSNNPNIINVKVIYRCTKCGDISLVNPLIHKKDGKREVC